MNLPILEVNHDWSWCINWLCVFIYILVNLSFVSCLLRNLCTFLRYSLLTWYWLAARNSPRSLHAGPVVSLGAPGYPQTFFTFSRESFASQHLSYFCSSLLSYVYFSCFFILCALSLSYVSALCLLMISVDTHVSSLSVSYISRSILSSFLLILSADIHISSLSISYISRYTHFLFVY